MPRRHLAPFHWLAISLVLMAALLTVPALAADRRSSLPVLAGEVVALADNVVTSDRKTGAKMVFKNARPVQAVLDLISPK